MRLPWLSLSSSMMSVCSYCPWWLASITCPASLSISSGLRLEVSLSLSLLLLLSTLSYWVPLVLTVFLLPNVDEMTGEPRWYIGWEELMISLCSLQEI